MKWPTPADRTTSLMVTVRAALLLTLLVAHLPALPASTGQNRTSPRAIWQQERAFNKSGLTELRRGAWDMFDHGFSNYMEFAFPKDNLLPISCKGENWQGGIALTLIDSLDSLLLMNRRGDMVEALELLRREVSFDKDVKVHVFEVVIRGLGGLLSAHVLLLRDPSLVPHYDGLLLRMATDLADRLLPAFDTPSGLPSLYVNLAKGMISEPNYTCTACAGTLLLEFGMLSALTSNPVYMNHAQRCARTIFEKRSRLGLVGSSLDVSRGDWAVRESTTGPGTDSYYEYLLKAYLMFGKREYLDMFADLYVSTMRHLQVPGNIRGFTFLADVHMDSGRLTRPFVSSLAAFWPGMQSLVGQDREAEDLHANFTAAWTRYGWLPESFGLDLGKVDAEDPGYNLRPEHVESTYMLHCANPEDDLYLGVARNVLETLQQHNHVECGFAQIRNVGTGEPIDLMESFFLSETVKYLYLTFADAPELIDYYIFSTEGHLFPVFGDNFPGGGASSAQEAEDEEDRATAVLEVQGGLPANCERICARPNISTQAVAERRLRGAFPLLQFSWVDASVLRRRRCAACAAVSRRLAEVPVKDNLERAKMMKLTPDAADTAAANAAAQGVKAVLSQVLCTLQLARMPGGHLLCNTMRGLTQADVTNSLPTNSVVLQLSQVEAPEPPRAVVLSIGGTGGDISIQLHAWPAAFGPRLPLITEECHQVTLNITRPTGEPFECPAPRMCEELGIPPALCDATAPPAVCLWKDAPRAGADEEEEVYGALNVPPGGDPCQGIPLVSARLVIAHPLEACHPVPPLPSPPPGTPATAHGTLGQAEGDEGECGCDAGSGPGERAFYEDAVVLVGRGGCSFMSKVLRLQEAGARGVIVVNRAGDDELVVMTGPEGADAAGAQAPRIPAVAVGHRDGVLLMRAARQQPLSATLALRAAGGGQPVGRASVLPVPLTTRVDLLIPTGSHAFLTANVMGKGQDLSHLFQTILADGRGMQVMMAVAEQNGYRGGTPGRG